ncbi:MAG TPA: hypothetical protein DCM38_08720 [Gammaproteobacteria bacterium]|nr:hypothetical protein [Gammaproteobacteria bacterium]
MEDSMFCGSYEPDDISFLLKPISMTYTDVLERERIMQVEGKHYSEMIPKEYLPSAQYQAVFYTALELNKHKLAQHILALANRLNDKENLVLVSLARAGTPVGVLLKRTLRDLFNRNVPHYSISIILDRGIDANALHYILSQHDKQGKDIVFIDGWTGKGGITRELQKWVTVFNQKHNTQIATDLYVIADIGGYATVAVTSEDYIIPSALLNATINGLISRTILNPAYLGPEDFHGCKYYSEFSEDDLSIWYVEQLMAEIKILEIPNQGFATLNREALQKTNQNFVNQLMTRYQITDIKFIRPGIGEAIRVLLRRVPYKILVQDKTSPEIAPFLVLAEEKQVPVEEMKDMPYKAAGIVSLMTS